MADVTYWLNNPKFAVLSSYKSTLQNSLYYKPDFYAFVERTVEVAQITRGTYHTLDYTISTSTYNDNLFNDVIAKTSKYLIRETSMDIMLKLDARHPVRGYDCAAAIVNPFTAKMEWVSINCSKQYELSQIICESRISNQDNQVDLTIIGIVDDLSVLEGEISGDWTQRYLDA